MQHFEMVGIYIWRKLPLPFLKGLSITEHEFFSHLFGPTIFFNQKRIFFLIYKNFFLVSATRLGLPTLEIQS